MSVTQIDSVHARQVFDSRGRPTVEVELSLRGGDVARASVPSGANQFGRSQPPREPNTARRAASTSWSGLRRTPRELSCSDPGAVNLEWCP